MIRLLQLSARSLVVAPSTLNGVATLRSSARPVCLELRQHRPISITSFCNKQKGSSLSSPSSSSSDQRGGKKKRSLMDVASDTLENVGLKTRSKSKTGGTANQGTQRESRQSDLQSGDKSMSGRRSPDHLPSRNAHQGGSWGASTTNVSGQEFKSSARSRSKQAPDHRAAGPVRHDKQAKRFVLDLGNNQLARIDYNQLDKGRIELYHTEVPEELRGRGIGKALAKGALECASRENLKLKVTCSYLQDYLKRFADDKYRRIAEF